MRTALYTQAAYSADIWSIRDERVGFVNQMFATRGSYVSYCKYCTIRIVYRPDVEDPVVLHSKKHS